MKNAPCVFSFYASVLFIALVNASSASETLELSSPNGVNVATITIGSDGAKFSLTSDGTPILNSTLGLTFRDAAPLGALEVVGVERRTIDETWRGIGRKAEYANRCVEASVDVREVEEPSRKLRLIFRAYDEGFAFRYAIPEDAGVFDERGEFCLESDDSTFSFAKDYDARGAWFQGYATNSEGAFVKKKLSDVKEGDFLGRPLVVEGDDFVVALTESDLLDWSGAQFTGTSDPLSVKVLLAPRDDKRGAVVRRGACCSPWRVAIVGKKPRDLINNSDIIRNVATELPIDDSWVRTGNCSWDWWAPKSGRKVTNEAFQQFIDFSAEMGWEFALVDAGWYKGAKNTLEIGPEGLVAREGFDPVALVEYGKQKGVSIILWIDWPDLVQVGVRRTLERVAAWGVAGVKIDHMNSHSQEMVAALTETTRVAAECKLLVNYHGMYEPTGLERTYPNQITREGIQGNEYFRGRALTPTFVATLPFTRAALGPADYTPCGFRNAHREDYKTLKEQTAADASTAVLGTRARELALCVVLDSPLRCLCDLPRVYRGQNGLDFLKNLPAAWDDTLALDGAIGEFCVVARRRGNDWYLSAITNEQGRSLDLTFDFLEEGATYEATFYSDSPRTEQDATDVLVTSSTVRKGDALRVVMARDGGWNVVLVKQ